MESFSFGVLKALIKQNYKFYPNIYSITIYNKYFCCHVVMMSAAVTTLLLVAGVGVKRRADRRGSTVRVTASVCVSCGNCHCDRNLVF